MTKTIYDIPEDEIRRVVGHYQTEHKLMATILNASASREKVMVTSGRFTGSISSNWHDGDKIDIHITGIHYKNMAEYNDHMESAKLFYAMVLDIRNALERMVQDDTWRPYQ